MCISWCFCKLTSSFPMQKLHDCSGTYTSKYLIFSLHQRSFISGINQQQINFMLPTQHKYISISWVLEAGLGHDRRLKDNLKSSTAHLVISWKLIILISSPTKTNQRNYPKKLLEGSGRKEQGGGGKHFAFTPLLPLLFPYFLLV